MSSKAQYVVEVTETKVPVKVGRKKYYATSKVTTTKKISTGNAMEAQSVPQARGGAGKWLVTTVYVWNRNRPLAVLLAMCLLPIDLMIMFFKLPIMVGIRLCKGLAPGKGFEKQDGHLRKTLISPPAIIAAAGLTLYILGFVLQPGLACFGIILCIVAYNLLRNIGGNKVPVQADAQNTATPATDIQNAGTADANAPVKMVCQYCGCKISADAVTCPSCVAPL